MKFNYEIEQRIAKKSDEYCYKGSVVNFLLLLLNTLEDLKKEEENTIEFHPDIVRIRKEINDMICCLEDVLNDEQKSKEYFDKALKIKDEILSIYKGIYGYFSNWKISSTRIMDEISLRKYFEESDDNKQINFEYLYQRVEEFITSAQTLSAQKRNMGQILACIPYKGTDEDYFKFVKKCLAFAFKGQSEDLIEKSLEIFMELYAPELIPNYGKYLPDLADWLEQTKEYMPSSLTDEMLDEAQKTFEEKFEVLSKTEEYFTSLLNDINALIGLYYIRYDFDEITLNQFRIRDAYLSICELIKHNAGLDEVEAVEDPITEILEDTVDELLSDLNVIISTQMEYLSTVQNFDEFDDETKICLEHQTFIRTLRLEDINSEIFSILTSADGAPASKEFVDSKTDEFIEKLKNYFNTLPAQYKRCVMRDLFNSVPPVYSIKNIIDALRKGIDECNNINEKLIIIDKIGFVFNENYFSDKKIEIPEEQ